MAAGPDAGWWLTLFRWVSCWLQEAFQVSPAVDNSDDFDFLDGTFVGVGVGFIEDEVGAFDENAGGWSDVPASDAEAGMLREEGDLGLHGIEEMLCRRWIVEGDIRVNLNQIFTSLRCPDEINRHVPYPLALRQAAVVLRGGPIPCLRG